MQCSNIKKYNLYRDNYVFKTELNIRRLLKRSFSLSRTINTKLQIQNKHKNPMESHKELVRIGSKAFQYHASDQTTR